jgi:hypothetical protein
MHDRPSWHLQLIRTEREERKGKNKKKRRRKRRRNKKKKRRKKSEETRKETGTHSPLGRISYANLHLNNVEGALFV